MEDIPGVIDLEDMPGVIDLEDIPGVIDLEDIPGVIDLERHFLFCERLKAVNLPSTRISFFRR